MSLASAQVWSDFEWEARLAACCAKYVHLGPIDTLRLTFVIFNGTAIIGSDGTFYVLSPFGTFAVEMSQDLARDLAQGMEIPDVAS